MTTMLRERVGRFINSHHSKEIFDALILVNFFALLIWSGIRPLERLEWSIEIFFFLLILAPFLGTYNKFAFTTTTYLFGLWFIFILAIGAHYTYVRVPISEDITSYFHLNRDYFDRFVHFFQGFVPFFAFRELLIRKSGVKITWATFLSVTFALAFSAAFEFCEWGVTVTTGYDLIAGQGDRFDTQADMFMAFVGAIVCAILFARFQDRLLNRQFGSDLQPKN